MGDIFYKVMPFGLKNNGATYQCVMIVIFHDTNRKYVDDMLGK